MYLYWGKPYRKHRGIHDADCLLPAMLVMIHLIVCCFTGLDLAGGVSDKGELNFCFHWFSTYFQHRVGKKIDRA